MRSTKWCLAALAGLAAGIPAARAVNDLSYDQLISVVIFEDENAYADPTGYFCRFIALDGKDDYCKATLRTLDPKLCKVEVTREMRVTFNGGKGLEYLRSRDVFNFANLDLTQVKEPEVDYDKKTSRQSFESGIDIKWHDGQKYTFALNGKGGYRACVAGGAEKDIPEADCKAAGIEKPEAFRKMSLLYNTQNYNRAMAAIRWLQKSYCTRGDEL